MKDELAFINIKRKTSLARPVSERLKDYRDVAVSRDEACAFEQASRCLDCGIPFCHWSCPIGNYVPAWNEHLANGRWKEAFFELQATNNIPEITGRLCPAVCESACVLGIGGEAVTIREDELSIIEHAFRSGFVEPHPPAKRSGKSVAIIGSGPAGICCADQLNKAGHRVMVFERDDKIGGLLRYGIPDFKLEKWIIDRRVDIWRGEGIEFATGVDVGRDYPVKKLMSDFDAVCLAGGCRVGRDLSIPGRELSGIYFAMDYLAQSNRRVAGKSIAAGQVIDAKGKRVVVIGGGDTGADCVGTANRQGASRVVQIEILPQPPQCRSPEQPWPEHPMILRTSSSHEEGGQRLWSILTKQFVGKHNTLEKLSCVRVEWIKSNQGRIEMKEVPGTNFDIEADLAFLALGFLHPEPKGLLEGLNVKLDARGNIITNQERMTSADKVFAAGDMRRGQSLIVWAVSEGRTAAHYMDRHLMGRSDLPLL